MPSPGSRGNSRDGPHELRHALYPLRCRRHGYPEGGQLLLRKRYAVNGARDGEVADFLLKPDGTRVAGVSLIENTLTKYPGIDQMQIVQETADGLTLRLVTGPAFSRREAEALVDYFHQVFGRKTDVRLEIADEIRPESSGKYRFSICRIP